LPPPQPRSAPSPLSVAGFLKLGFTPGRIRGLFALLLCLDLGSLSNMKDFPVEALAPHNLIAEHPDIFIRGLLDADPQSAVTAFAIDRAAMTMPPMTAERYLAALDRASLVTTAAALKAHIHDI
jgi:hypothetical protein